MRGLTVVAMAGPHGQQKGPALEREGGPPVLLPLPLYMLCWAGGMAAPPPMPYCLDMLCWVASIAAWRVVEAPLRPMQAKGAEPGVGCCLDQALRCRPSPFFPRLTPPRPSPLAALTEGLTALAYIEGASAYSPDAAPHGGALGVTALPDGAADLGSSLGVGGGGGGGVPGSRELLATSGGGDGTIQLLGEDERGHWAPVMRLTGAGVGGGV